MNAAEYAGFKSSVTPPKTPDHVSTATLIRANLAAQLMSFTRQHSGYHVYDEATCVREALALADVILAEACR